MSTNHPPQDDVILTVAQVCELLGPPGRPIARRTFRELVASGRLRARKGGDTRGARWYIRRSAVDDFLNGPKPIVEDISA